MKYLYLLFCVMAFISCKHDNKNSMNEELVKLIRQNDQQNKIKACLVIPRAGCTGCIGSALNYAKTNLNKMPAVKIILTDIGDQRLAKIQLGESFMKDPHVVVDTAHRFQNQFDTPYPTVFYLNDSYEVTSSKKFDPDTDDLVNLK